MSAGLALIERLAEQRTTQSLADAEMARAAYDAGDISWNDLKDVVSHLLISVTPEWCSIPEESTPPAQRADKRCACGATIPARYRKCDGCIK